MHVVTTTDEAAARIASGAAWRLTLLGPIELCHDGRPVEVSGSPRSLLALLALTPGQVVSTDVIVSGMWGGDVPDNPERALASCASRLRKAIATAVPGEDADLLVLATPLGYLLAVDRSNVDLAEFERLAIEGRRALDIGQPSLAVARLREALELWRGDAYADLGGRPFARAESSRLAELRLTALESRVDAELAAAAPHTPPGLAAELQTLTTDHPHRERLWIQLMMALNRDGRQADALAAYEQAQIRFVEDLGASPPAELRRAARAVQAGDPALHGTPITQSSVPDAIAASLPACVGRDEELAWLEAALDIAATRRGQGRLVIGGPGIGKTRLVAELAHRVAVRGVVIRYSNNGTLDALVAEPDRLTLVIVDDIDLAGRSDLPSVASFILGALQRPVLTLMTATDPVRIGDLATLPKLVLGPLGPPATAELVRLYAPGTNDTTAAAAMVNTGGVPVRVHRAASEWAFARAGRRIDRGVANAAEAWGSLISVRDEIVAGVRDLEHVRAQARVLRPSAREVVACPYKGLARFEASDADLFLGRERLVAELVAGLVESKLLAVVGTSGSGKSSVLRAGLLPALAAGVLPDSGRWRQIVVTPATAGDLPARVGVDDATVLVVDQFEEAFTALDSGARRAFLDMLVEVATGGRAIVVIALRSDFYPRCSDHAGLSRLVTANTLLVRPMAVDEIRRTIEHPAAMAGLSIEDGLADVLANDARDAPGGLASLSAALLSLWERRVGRTLTLAAYRAGGGVTGSVEALGERTYAALPSEEARDAARRILVRLADSGGSGPVVGRRTSRAELVATGGPGGEAALEVLASRRLITVTDGVVEVAHEVVLTHWPRLRTWLEEDAAGRELRARLAPAASAWAASTGGAHALYRGARLAATLDWVREHPGELTGAEGAFLAASQDAVLAGELRDRRRVRRLRQLLTAAVAAFVVATAGGVVAINQQQRADAANLSSDARRLTAEAIAEPDLRVSVLLAVAAMRLDDSGQARDGLRTVLRRSPRLAAAAGITTPDRVTAVALSPDGKTVAAASSSGSVWLYESDGLRPAGRLAYPGHGPVNGVAFTPDGRRLVSWGGSRVAMEKQPPTSIVVWDLATGQPIGSAFGEAWPDTGGGLLADGVTLLLRQQHPTTARPPTPVAWNIAARTPSTAYELPSAAVDALAVMPGGRTVISGSAGGALIFEPVTGASRTVPRAMKPLALSPDGRTLLAAEGSDVVAFDASSGARRGVARRHVDDVVSAAWASDGRTFASVGADGLVVVWDAATLQPRDRMTGGSDAVRLVQFSVDGRTLFTAGDDGALLAWDLTGTRGVGAALGAASGSVSLLRLACEIAGRDLTREEWTRHLPGRPYRHVCP
jgi:DNA-binding SARP family transcriptional activator